jgi:RNA polymerase primary sigma factor
MATNHVETEIGLYLAEIRQYPLLTADREKILSRRWRENRNESARQEMIRSNLRLVVSVARRFNHRGVALADLIAEGNIGLVRAVDLFDPTKNIRFSTYATWWIRQAVRQGILNTAHPIRVPAYMNQLVNNLGGSSLAFRDRFGRNARPEELAREMKTSLRAITHIQSAALCFHGSVSDAAGADETDTLMDMLMDRSTPAPDCLLEQAEMRCVLDKYLMRLNPRESLIIRLRHGLNTAKPQTLEQIARRAGLTRERIRQIEVGALRKLAVFMRGREYLMEKATTRIKGAIRQAAVA